MSIHYLHVFIQLFNPQNTTIFLEAHVISRLDYSVAFHEELSVSLKLHLTW